MQIGGTRHFLSSFITKPGPACDGMGNVADPRAVFRALPFRQCGDIHGLQHSDPNEIILRIRGHFASRLCAAEEREREKASRKPHCFVEAVIS